MHVVTELFKTVEQHPLKAFGDIQEVEQYVRERVMMQTKTSTDTLRQAYAVIAVDSFIQWDVFCLVG